MAGEGPNRLIFKNTTGQVVEFAGVLNSIIFSNTASGKRTITLRDKDQNGRIIVKVELDGGKTFSHTFSDGVSHSGLHLTFSGAGVEASLEV